MKIYEGEHHGRRGISHAAPVRARVPGAGPPGGVPRAHYQVDVPPPGQHLRRRRGSIGGSSLFERMERDANSSIDSSDDEASTSSGFATLLAGRAPPADPGQAPPGFHEEMAARMGIPRPAAAADPEEDS